MAAGSMKDIKLRIKSVQSTMQITKAMELVASSKLRRAKLRVEQSRPYFTVLNEALVDIASSNTEFMSPYTKKREIRRSCYIVIAGDRGLAGGYNSNVFKLVDAAIEGKDAVILPMGKKSVEHYQRMGRALVTESFAVAADISVSACFEAARMVAEKYVAYTNFVSMLSQTPAALRVLPFNCHPAEKGEKTGPRDMILYEPNSEEVFDAIIPE